MGQTMRGPVCCAHLSRLPPFFVALTGVRDFHSILIEVLLTNLPDKGLDPTDRVLESSL